MTRARARMTLIALALSLGAAGAALGSRAASAPPPSADRPVEALDAFAVAKLLAEAPPDVVVITLDAPKRPLRGAVPAGAYGADDAAFVRQAPKVRKLILAGTDQVRMDRVARQLIASGRRVAVLAGGVEAWDRAMDADPPAPASSAGDAAWSAHRTKVALRRSFGDAAAAAPVPVAAPIAPAMAAPSGPKKREGC